MEEQPRRDGNLYQVEPGTWKVVCGYCKEFEGKDPPEELVFGAPTESGAKLHIEQAGWRQSKSKNMYRQKLGV